MAFRLKTKKSLDTWVGVPGLMVLDFMARLLGLLMGRSHRAQPVNSVLITKFQGMGSLAIAKSAIQKLRKTYPQARFVFWGTAGTAILAQQMPEFDEVLVLNDSSLWRALASLTSCLVRLWKLKIDWAFDLEVYSKLSSVLATLSCARNRAGFAVESVRLRRFVHTHLVMFNRYVFLGEAYLRLLALAAPEILTDGAAESLPSVASKLSSWRVPASPHSRLARLGPYVVLNIHAGELCHERRWPVSAYARLALKIIQDYSLDVVLIGHGAFEKQECAKMPKHERIHDVCSELSVGETIACLAAARAVVSNDTAALHLALSVSPAVLGLFGPTRAETYFPPNRARALALSQNVYCSPCVHHWEPTPCGGNNVCMKNLDFAAVYQSLQSLLDGEPHGKINHLPNQSASNEYYQGLIFKR